MLGATIRQYRKQRGWKQQTLAGRVGTTQSVISEIENGGRSNLTRDLLERLAKALEVPLSVLLSESEAPDPDLSQPPIELLQAAGYTEETIARVVATWRDWSDKDRLEAVQNAQHELDLATEVTRLRQAQESALREKLDAMLLMLSP